jgi:uncharacterized protein YndB with AHSA1/START domain
MKKHVSITRLSFICVAAGLASVSNTALSQDRPQPSQVPQRIPITTMQADLAGRSHDIHWPEGFEPAKADLFSHNELVINASCERLWGHIIDATKWPGWYPNSKDVRIVGNETVLHSGSVFRWTTFSLSIESRINEFVPYSRIGWYGYAPGTEPSFYHTWYLVPQGGACLAVTDEVGKGPDAAHLRQTDEGLMHRGHDLWLATLRWVAENP